MSKIVKAVVRYATIMEAGHTDKYNKDYANALYKIVNNAGKIDPEDLERAKDNLALDNIQEPLVDLFKSVLSKDNYFDGLEQITKAYRKLEDGKKLKEAIDEWDLKSAQNYYIWKL